jgi:hypothetical protein
VQTRQEFVIVIVADDRDIIVAGRGWRCLNGRARAIEGIYAFPLK